MPLDFPSNPTVNELYIYAGRTWVWNGAAWDSYNPGITAYVSRLNGFTGGVTLAEGSNVTISSANNVITISSSASGGGSSVVTSFNGLTGAVTGVGSFNGSTGTVVFSNYVSSFNGLIGAVTGVTTANVNTFTALQTFSNGIVSTGATLSGTVSITGLPTPTAAADAANKAYVDDVASVGVHYHDPVALASTDLETFASGVTYSNGASGVGATLTKTAPFARLNIDSTNGVTADRILVRSASTQQWNGVYTVTDQGSASNAWILTRSTDANNYHPYFNDGLGANDYFFVSSGATLKGNAYICNVPDGITFGTTPITFALFSTPPVYTAGTGLALNGLQFSNTGVLSIDGSTGAVTNVARTNTTNTFTTTQVISGAGAPTFQVADSDSQLSFLVDPSSSSISLFNDSFGEAQILQFTDPIAFTKTISLPDYDTTLAGLAGNQTFTGTNTFTKTPQFNAGISAAGATFTGQVTVKTFKADTVGGDEGGQIDFGIPITNTSLTGGVAIDVYQNKLRFFETGGTARGAYIDLTTADAGAGRDILGVVKSLNGDTGAVKLYFPTYNEHETRSGITAQSDYSVFTDFVGNNFSSSIAQAGWLGINANGGSFTISTASITSYGFDKCNGVINFITGTTNNTTGYAGCLLQASHIPGIPTPSNGFVTKYEIECRFMTDTDVTTDATKTRIGFADTWTNSAAADGVYFERTYDTLLPLTETTFQVVFRNGGSEERINTGVTFAASTIYRTYLCVERDSSGTLTTSWEILNDTTNVTSSGTASPTTTARYPTASTDYINPGCIIQKTGSVTTATSRLIRVDYIGTRIRRPLNRSMKLFA